MKPAKHTLDSANVSLKLKGLDYFLSIKNLDFESETATVSDIVYGIYYVDFKSLAPKSIMPLHRQRKHQIKVDTIRKKFIGVKVNGLTVVDVFYGLDKGYKNRSFYLEYLGECGHSMIGTYAFITKHKKTLSCMSCSKTDHGARGKTEGVLKKRTPTYIFWQLHKDELPEKYQDFSVFRSEAGDKPFKKAEMQMLDGRPTWIDLGLSKDQELNLIAVAIRQAFRHSEIYKSAVAKARVETETGVRYRCNSCKDLFKLDDIQVDHIDPVEPVDGSGLTKDILIDRIWTTNIQILHKGCHTVKSSIENKERRRIKKDRKACQKKRK